MLLGLDPAEICREICRGIGEKFRHKGPHIISDNLSFAVSFHNIFST